MSNIVPIPENLPGQPNLGASSPLVAASGGVRTSPVVRYLAAIRRAKWLVLLLTLAGVGGGVVVSRLKPPSYVVNSALQLSPDENSAFVGQQYDVYLKSYQIIEPVVLEHRLYIIGPTRIGAPPPPAGPSGPAAALFNNFDLASRSVPGNYRLKIASDGRSWEFTNSQTGRVDRGAAGDSVGRPFGFLWAPVVEPKWFGESFDFQVITSHEAADNIKKHLTVDLQPFQAPRFMQLTLEGSDPDRTAAVLNDLMSRFVEQTSLTKRSNLHTATEVLDSQLTTATARLDADQRALQSYRVKIITLPRDELPVAPGLAQTQPGAYSAYLSRTNQLATLKRDREAMVDALAKLRAGKPAVDLFNAIPSAKLSPELMSYLTELMQQDAQLQLYRQRYTDSMVDAKGDIDMPRLVEHVKQLETVTIPAFANVVIHNLDDMIAQTDSEVQTGGKELQQIPQRTIEENSLEREQSVDADIVGKLTQQYYAARVQEASAPTDVTILDQAVAPLLPNKNKQPVIIAAGTLLGLVLGLGLAFLLDMTDKRVRYADQISGGLGLTILGVIPEIRRAKGEQATAEEAAQVIESFRTVRLNLAHAISQDGVILTISSPSPGDGKSLVSSNLALSFAESGYRTLLIDGDTRRGELHRTFGAERRPGLLDYLVGELELEKLLRTTTHPGLQLITSGSRKRNGPELLGTVRMRELLTLMRSRFEVIIVDSPPLGAGIDPFVLGTLTGNLLLVLRAGATERDLAEAKLQIVDQLPIRLVGAVLNDVRSTMNDYKYYSYSYGYGAVEEGPDPKSLGPVKEPAG
jgi:capsular exopolysaccharide synthesis family protein